MRLNFVVAACAVAAACWISPGVVSAAEANLPGTTTTPADLVRAALKSELGGPSDLRRTLLDEAIKRDHTEYLASSTPKSVRASFVVTNWSSISISTNGFQSTPGFQFETQRRF